MLQRNSHQSSFAQGVIGVNVHNIIGNSDAMNFDMMSEIEKELLDNPYDMISLVYLLYEVPDTALQYLVVYQTISSDAVSCTTLNILHQWLRQAKHNPDWKHEFVEALLICQLYSIVTKLGFNVPSARKYYQTDSITVKMFVNPMKKALYKLCESINSDNLLKLKKSLLTYDIDTTEYESCELVFLKLMSQKFITINQSQNNRKVDVNNLLKIVQNLPGLRKIVLEIEMLQQSMNNEHNIPSTAVTSTPFKHIKVDESTQGQGDQEYYRESFDDIFEIINLQLDETTSHETLKSDRKQLSNESYTIKNLENVGTCVIINQENFYPSKNSIELSAPYTSLDKRYGSDKDQMALEKTMESLNFTVISEKDLNHKKMMEFILDAIMNKVSEDDSIFMLCILSHGVKGQVFAADSVKVKMDDIQNLLDSDAAVKIRNIPKVLIIEACQVEEDSRSDLVADNPKNSYDLKKNNFLLYYATSPELEAYRHLINGSIFIQLLCSTIRKFAYAEHVLDIFTKVNNCVTSLCKNVGREQVPKFESTLVKKLYLQIPQ